MRGCSLVLVLVLFPVLGTADDKDAKKADQIQVVGENPSRLFRFGKEEVGKVPKGWKVAQTGKGEGSVWKVVADDTAPSHSGFVLAQTAESPSALFNLCVADDTSYKDVEV